MEKINKDLEKLKNRINQKDVIIGNSTQIIKDLLKVIYNIEKKIIEIYDKFDIEIKNIKEVQNDTKLGKI